MSFASDKLYKGYLRRNMPKIVSTVKVRQIVAYLPCLTDHDRENIEAKRETYGNYDSMVLLLDCLKRRENWPEQFIEALEACEHSTIAAEIRAEYNALLGVSDSNPGSPPTTVVRAHVHPAPSASPPSVAESDGKGQADVAPPAEASAPPEPAAPASPPLEMPVQPQAPQSSAPPVPQVVSPPEPPQSAQAEVVPPPATPPPSPETRLTQATATPPPQREVTSHQEPVENSESDIQDFSGVIPDQASAGNNGTPPPSRPAAQCETEVTPPPSQISSDVTDGSSFPIMTPEKAPVQDTTPPVDITPAPVLEPEETSEPPAAQVVESSPQAAAPNSPLCGAARMDASLRDDSTVCLSKPGQLISIRPQNQNHDSPTIPAPSSPVEPYSGNSERLEISDATPDAVTQSPVCSAVSSTIVNTVSALPCQENGIVSNHNEPEENHYESPAQSLEMQEVLVNVGHVSEEPSILNLAGQSSTPHAQIVNGEAAKEIASAPPLSTNTDTVNAPSGEEYRPCEPAPELKTLQDSEKEKAPRTLTYNTKYIVAAGVGACALLMAWKFKN